VDLGQIDQLRTERNSISALFKSAPAEERAALGAQAKEAGSRAGELEKELSERDTALNSLLLRVPNIPYDAAPVGPDETFNVVIRKEGEPPKFDFESLDHVALIEKNDWADLSRVTQVSGSRTYCLKGAFALLETKLMAWALEKISNAGFTSITVPAIAREQAFLNQGQFPGHEEETYQLPNDDLWLRHRRSGADIAPFGPDHRRRQTADPARGIFALLQAGGGKRGQGRTRPFARPSVRQGRAICDLRGG
jgi:seryl-tRNA synthetase